MVFLPNMQPAAPEAPEHITYKKLPLRYGLLGRLFQALDRKAEAKSLGRLDPSLRRDLGFTDRGAETMHRRASGFAPHGTPARVQQRLDAEAAFSFGRLV